MFQSFLLFLHYFKFPYRQKIIVNRKWWRPTHPHTSSLVLHSILRTSIIFPWVFASLKVFQFWSFESFQAWMQHKVCFKWPVDPWIPLKSLLGKTCPRHQSWRELTIWRKTLIIYVDKIMDVVTWASFA
jgi:hypothetical protein